MIPHEQAALKVHSQAREFRPVKRAFGTGLHGWTFQVPASERSASMMFSWVTADGQVSNDKMKSLFQAERNLKAYVRNRPVGAAPRPVLGPLEGMK